MLVYYFEKAHFCLASTFFTTVQSDYHKPHPRAKQGCLKKNSLPCFRKLQPAFHSQTIFFVAVFRCRPFGRVLAISLAVLLAARVRNSVCGTPPAAKKREYTNPLVCDTGRDNNKNCLPLRQGHQLRWRSCGCCVIAAPLLAMR